LKSARQLALPGFFVAFGHAFPETEMPITIR
jgi:hypothetical protein